MKLPNLILGAPLFALLLVTVLLQHRTISTLEGRITKLEVTTSGPVDDWAKRETAHAADAAYWASPKGKATWAEELAEDERHTRARDAALAKCKALNLVPIQGYGEANILVCAEPGSASVFWSAEREVAR